MANRADWDAYADEYQSTHGEYLGDAGQNAAGAVYVQSAPFLPADIHFYDLTAVYDNYPGGATVHVGYIRVWTHPRLDL